MGDYTNLSVNLDIDVPTCRPAERPGPAHQAADALRHRAERRIASRSRSRCRRRVQAPADAAVHRRQKSGCQEAIVDADAGEHSTARARQHAGRGLPGLAGTLGRHPGDVSTLPGGHQLPMATRVRPAAPACRGRRCSGAASAGTASSRRSTRSRGRSTRSALRRASGYDPGIGTLLLQGVARSDDHLTHQEAAASSSCSSRWSASPSSAPATPGSTGCSTTRRYTVDAHFAESGGIFTGAEVTYRGVGIGQVSDDEADRRRRRRRPGHRQGARQDPARHAGPGRQQVRGRRAVRRAPAADRRRALPQGRLGDRRRTTPRSRSRPRSSSPTSTTWSARCRRHDLRTVVAESGRGVQGHRARPRPDHRHLERVHRDRQRQLRHHHGADPRLATSSCGPRSTRARRSAASPGTSRCSAAPSPTTTTHLRTLIDNGSATANELRTFLEQNQVDLGQPDQQPGHHRRGHRQAPRRASGRCWCSTRTSSRAASHGGDEERGRQYDAQFGLILQQDPPVCKKGYESTERAIAPEPRRHADERERPLLGARLEVERPWRPERAQPAPASYRAPVVATYDADPGKVTWTDQDPAASVSLHRWRLPASARTRGSGCCSSPWRTEE